MTVNKAVIKHHVMAFRTTARQKRLLIPKNQVTSFKKASGLFCYPPPPPRPTDKIIFSFPLADAQLSSMLQVSV